MANLKSLLSTTLTSFLNSKRAWSTNQVMPSATNITITPETVSEISENYFMFTAPYDGWVSLSGSRDGTSSSNPSFYVASRAVGGGHNQCGVRVLHNIFSCKGRTNRSLLGNEYGRENRSSLPCCFGNVICEKGVTYGYN